MKFSENSLNVKCIHKINGIKVSSISSTYFVFKNGNKTLLNLMH